MATIKQIASMAGVSRGTVDRVLNNRGVVKPETAEKIREIAKLLNYTPSKIGKTLAVKKKNLKFGYVLFGSTSSNPFFADIVKGIEIKAKDLVEYGVSVDVRYSEFDNPENQVKLIDELMAAGIHGLAITPINHKIVASKIEELTAKGIPVVTVNSDIENSGRLAYVGSNYLESGKTAGGLLRLFTNGNANVGIVVGSMEILCHSERIKGFKENIDKYSPNIRIVDIVTNHDDDFESYVVTQELLKKHPEIDSLFLASAGVYGACRAVQSMNLQSKLKIISFDCVETTKKLVQDGIISATIDQQPLKQGSEPLEILFNYLGMDIKPVHDKYYTNIDIKIRENL